MWYNHTRVGLGVADRMFNVTGVISGPFAQTFYQCFVFEKQVQETAVSQFASFLDINDMMTSALFNLFARSIDLRTYGYDLIEFSEAEQWVLYT